MRVVVALKERRDLNARYVYDMFDDQPTHNARRECSRISHHIKHKLLKINVNLNWKERILKQEFLPN